MSPAPQSRNNSTLRLEETYDNESERMAQSPAGAPPPRCRRRRDCAGLPDRVFAQARKNTLVLGIDISDTITLDPARLAQYTSPMTVSAAYDSLVTMKPGEYINVAPSLATKWARTPDGKGWRFTLRDGVKFSTGNVMTVEDVKWSFDRVINLGDQPSQYIAHVDRVEIVDKSTIDIILKQPAEPLLTIIAAPEFVVMERKVAEAKRRHRREGRQDRRQGRHLDQRQFVRHRRLSDRRLGAQPADPARAQRALLGRQAAIRAHRHPPHLRTAPRSCWRCAAATSTRPST